MELQVIEQNAIVQAFAIQGGTDALFDRIASEARSFVPDVTTDKGRKAIGSLAAKVSSSKKLAEKYAIDLVAEKKAEVKVVDQDRIQFCKKMDLLRDEILAPRDAYQKAEDDRVARLIGRVELIKGFSVIQEHHTAKNIQESLNILDGMQVGETYQEYEQEAKIAKFETLEVLRTTLAAREKYEAEQAELEALRLAEQQRIQAERDAQIAREATEKANREAEEKARFEAERVQREKLEAEQREARLKAEKEAAELRAVQATENERKRIEAEQFAKEEADRKAEESRLANEKHCRTINNEAAKALIEQGFDKDDAKKIITAIINGQVPHISITY